jgi:Cu/Ag efflux protein CusF
MKIRQTRFVATTALAIALWTMAGPVGHFARADEANSATPAKVAIFTATANATVKAIDPANRLVTLQNENGDTAVIHCGKNVANFDQIQVGDQIRATLVNRVALFIGKPGSNTPNPSDVDLTELAPQGEKPAALIADTSEISAKIDSVDADQRTVTLQGEQGNSRTIKVSRDVDLASCKPGDEVTLVCTNGCALMDERAPQGAQPAAAKLPPQGAMPGGMGLDVARATAAVTAIDPDRRLVTLRLADGSSRTVHLGKQFINFDQIKVGDLVRATLAETVAVSVNKSGGAANEANEGANVLVARAPQGARPGMIIARTDEITAKIDSVDAANRTVTLAQAEGQPITVKVGPRVNLGDLQKGDDVTARVTQGLSIIVQEP